MKCRGKCSGSACGCLGLVISTIVAILTGVFFAYGYIVNLAVFAWVAFGLGASLLATLGISLLVAAVSHHNPITQCLCEQTPCILAGSIGTMLSALLVLTVFIRAIPFYLFVGVLGFFFSLAILGFIYLFSCFKCRLCEKKEA